MRVWPIEGREQEIATVLGAFAGTEVNAVLVLAGAGVGKTRLAREVLGRLECRTEWITASRAANAIPFGALAHVLPEDARAADAPVDLVRAVCSQVAGWGGRTRVAIGVDDAHLLDDASATVVANLVAAGTAFVVLTARPSEPLPDCLARLGKDGDAEILTLSPLPDPVIDRLIDHSTTGGLDIVERRRLRAAAKGNPLALRELLHGAVPGGLTDLVASRLDTVPPATRHVVEMVACGEPVPLTFLEHVAGAAAVADAEASGLVVCERSGHRAQARLDHPLSGDVLRARMGLARSRQIHRELAEQLLSTGLRRREDTLRAAVWQVEADWVIMPDLVRDGARLAIGLASLALAERLASAAREAEPGAESDWLLAEILEFQGRSAEAAELLPASPPRQPAEHVRWTVARADWLYWAGGDLAAAGQVLDTIAGHPMIEGARAFHLFFAGRCAEAVRAARSVLDDDSADPRAMVWATAAGTAALGFLGRLDEVEKVRERGAAVAAAHATSQPWAMFQVEAGACMAYLACGQVRAADAIADAGYQAAVREGVPMRIGWAFYGGITAATRGQLERAGTLLTEALTGMVGNDTFRLRRVCLAARAWVHALSGEHQPAGELMASADQTANGANEVFGPWIALWRAWITRAGGDTATALKQAEHAVDLAATAGMPGVATMARYEKIRLGGTADLSRPAGVQEPLAGVLADAARALGKHDGFGLTAAVNTFADLGYHLHAAELAMAAVRALRGSGHRARAELASTAAADLRARCRPARTPMLASDELNTLLSPRERQVVLLAAGHPSRQIAERLDLALSTVNNTLARAYAKLGVSGRAELRALLGESPRATGVSGPSSGGSAPR